MLKNELIWVGESGYINGEVMVGLWWYSGGLSVGLWRYTGGFQCGVEGGGVGRAGPAKVDQGCGTHRKEGDPHLTCHTLGEVVTEVDLESSEGRFHRCEV